MVVLHQTSIFKRLAKKLHQTQKKDLDNAIKEIQNSPEIGVQKKGDLLGIRVHKFRMTKQLTLLAYTYIKSPPAITLHAFGPHENFYRDLKN